MSPLLKNIKSVLIIRSGALGDLVYATSILDALIAQYGEDIKIDWITTPGSGTLFIKDPRVHQLFPLTHRKLPNILSAEKRAVINFSKKHPYDLAINLETGKPFSKLLQDVHAKNKLGAPYTSPTSGKPHMVEIIKRIYADAVSTKVLEEAAPHLIGSTLAELANYNLPKEYLVLNPSNSHNARHKLNYRAWPKEHWIELVNRLSDQNLVIIAGKGEEEYFKSIRPFPSHVIDLIGKSSLIDLVGIIQNATAIVTTDTGPAHIASAVNTDTHVLIGPTNVKSTGPYATPNNKISILSANLSCSPCYNTEVMKACSDNRCMREIPVEDVLDSLKKFNNI